jgi:transketolase
MRNAFINELFSIALANKKIWFLTGDLGFGVLDSFAKEIPDRFINVGVAEQNMTGIAAGLAMDGRTVFTYSIANFPTFRCLEQIRNDVCYHRADVKVVSVGAGVAYGSHGYTHFGVEDIGIMRVLPHMTILCPADPAEARRAARLAVESPGPMYIRLGKNGEPALHPGEVDYRLGDLIEMVPAGEINIIATGSIAYHACAAARECRAHGIPVGMFSCPTVAPFNIERFSHICSQSRIVITVEEHGPVGGLASVAAETLAQMDTRCRLVRLSLPQSISGVGTQEYFLNKFGLDAAGIAAEVQRISQSPAR